MNAINACARESEILETVGAGRSLSPELEQHSASCADCADLVVVASAFHADLEEATHSVEVPPSGLVWWRIQRREREHAVREATRAVTLAQTATVLGAVALALMILGGISALSETFRGTVSQFWASIHFREMFAALVPSQGWMPSQPWMMVLLFALFGTLAVGSLVVWLAVREE
jgi:hypothetical protein